MEPGGWADGDRDLFYWRSCSALLARPTGNGYQTASASGHGQRQYERTQILLQDSDICDLWRCSYRTIGPFNETAYELVGDIGRRIARLSGDNRESSVLFQRLSEVARTL